MALLYIVLWGRSVFFEEQDEATKVRAFRNSEMAETFLKRLNKRSDVDFTDLAVVDSRDVPKNLSKITLANGKRKV